MAKPLVSDKLWEEVEPRLPPVPLRPLGGRPRLPDRAVLTGIIFVLRADTPWELLPPERGCGSGMTCWWRLRDWQAQGVWEVLHWVLLQRLSDAEKLEWSRAALDSCSIPAQKGAKKRRESGRSRPPGHEAPRCGRARRVAACTAKSHFPASLKFLLSRQTRITQASCARSKPALAAQRSTG